MAGRPFRSRQASKRMTLSSLLNLGRDGQVWELGEVPALLYFSKLFLCLLQIG